MRLCFVMAAVVCVVGLLVSVNQQALAQEADKKAEKKRPVILKGHSDSVISVAFTADGKIMVAAGKGGTVSFWDLATGKERTRLKAHPEYLLAFAISRDEKNLATGTHYEVTVWDTATSKGRITLKDDTKLLYALALTADGKTLATASKDPSNDKPGQLLLWDVETGKRKATLQGLVSPIHMMVKRLAPSGNQPVFRYRTTPRQAA